MYNSYFSMIIAFSLVILSLLFLLERKHKPWILIINFFKNLLTCHRFASIIILMLTVLLLNKLELSLENTTLFNRIVDWDFTPFVHSFEGDFSVMVQKLENWPTTALLSFMYIFIFPALVWVSLIYYKYKEDDIAVRRTFFAFILNYIIAIPFYLFIPVNETWYGNHHVQLLISKLYPAFNTEYRHLSGLNNDFPSLHTSISWSLALVAVSLNYKRLAKILLACATLIAISTIYLGIHWFADVVAGITLAVIVVKIATKLSMKEFIPDLNINLSPAGLINYLNPRIKKRLTVVKQYLLELTTNMFS